MKVGFVFPLAKNRDNYLQINHIQNLKKTNNMQIKCYSVFTNDIEQDLYTNRSNEQEIWEAIRKAREEGQKQAYDDNCDWIIHHDYGELFFDDYLVRLEETLNTRLSLQFADFSYFSRFNKYQVVSPVFRLNEKKPFLVTDGFWKNVWNNYSKDGRYYQVRRGSSWIWHRAIPEFLKFKIKPQSDIIRRHDSNWREYLFEKGFKCILDTKLRKIDNTDTIAIEYYN